MIYLKILDNAGLGNQLFMFAMGYGMAERTGQSIAILSEFNKWSKRPYLLDELNIDPSYIDHIKSYKSIENYPLFRVIKKLNNLFYRHNLMLGRMIQPFNSPNSLRPMLNKEKAHYYVEGYWESYRYFDEYRDSLIKMYTLNRIDNYCVKDMIEKVRECDSVAVHIRKGDFEAEGRIFDFDYFIKAMEEMKSRLPLCHFFIFSLDEKVRVEFIGRQDCTVISKKLEARDIEEWMIMKHCVHHIVSNSTFSWWAAYLGDEKSKIVLKPSKQLFRKIEGKSEEDYNNFYPLSWIEVGN